MNVVVPMLLIMFLLGSYEKVVTQKIKIIFTIIIVLILSFSYHMGGDWLHYKDFYQNIVPRVELKNIEFKVVQYEKLYIYLNYFFYNIGFNYDFFMGFLRSLCLIYICKLLIKHSANYFYSIIIIITGFLFDYLTEPIIRQLIAVVISYYAVEKLIKRKYFSYILLVLIAYNFHASAIICFIYFPLCYFRINLKSFFIILLGCEVIFFNLENVILFLIKINENFYKYIPYINEIKGNSLGITDIVFSMIKIILYLLPIKYLGNIKNRRNKIYINFIYIYMIISILQDQLIYLSRFASYFFLGVAIILVKYNKLKLGSINIKRERLISIIIGLNIFIFSYSHLNSETLRYKYYKNKNYLIKFIEDMFKKDYKKINDIENYIREYKKLKNK